MSNSLLFHTQGIQGFHFLKWDWSGGKATAFIQRKDTGFSCSTCRSQNVTATYITDRIIQGNKMGRLPFFLQVRMHRVKCHDCGAYRMESLPFLSSELSRITRQLERTMIELRSEMSIKAVADYFQVDWRLVKRVEKTHLQKKYSTIRLADVKLIGIDEIYVGYKRYKTIVRDLESGAVLHVGEGKGGDALEGFSKRLAHSRASIETIAMDMAQGYGKWARKALPDATIVYDHFHLIKLMNEKVDKVRRKTVNELEEDERKALKKSATSS